MIHIPPLRTRRLTVQLKELSIGASIALAAMPVDAEEAGCTAFLRRAIESVKGIEDPAQWTVQERMLAVCQYLAAVTDDGPDFSLGRGRYSDYLDGASDMNPDRVPVGEVGGDTWLAQHLTGGMAESIERLLGEIDGLSGRSHWLMGGMAAQLVRASETPPNPADGEGAFDEYLAARMRVFTEFPGSDFSALMTSYALGRDKLDHLFHVDFSADERTPGLVALPKEGGSDLPPARFPFRSCLPRFALEMG